MPVLRRYTRFLRLGLVVVDSVCALLAHVLACWIMLPADGSVTFADQFWGHFAYFALFTAVWCAFAADQRLFQSRRGDSLFDQTVSVAKAVLYALVFTGFFLGFVRRQGLDREFVAIFGAGTLVSIVAFRLVARLFLWAIRRSGYNYRQILIVGANPRGKHLVDLMTARARYGYHLTGLLDDEPERAAILSGHGVPYLGKLEDVERVFSTHVIDEVFICLPVRRFYEEINSLAHLCEGVGKPVHLVADLFPLHLASGRVHQFEDIPLISFSAVPQNDLALVLKRCFDIAVSGFFLATVGWWLFSIVAIIIKLDSKGPVFFGQERVGLNQRRFRILKFRSMVTDAERLKTKLAELNEADGPVFKIRRDPRMTRVGRWLRKFSIDELPQLINVFLGHMSLVGPRPPLPDEVAKYTWDQRRRLSVRPGITGLQQVSGRSDLNFDQWVELDLAYIDNWSLMEDFRIIVRTFQVVMLARGAA